MPGNNFGFPKTLYDCQEKFIQDAINTIDNNQFGIFSSPTGSGKTLSLLCTCINFMEAKEDDLFDILNGASKTTIFYCSRTHSQLNQVMKELKTNKNVYKAVILGSRKVYCRNSDVTKSECDLEEINKKCHDLIQKEKCEYFLNMHYQAQNATTDELVKSKHKFCPYFYTKNKASECELVLLPYNLLFTEEGRKSLDVDLEGKIVIVDEAHNIYDTIVDLNTIEINFIELTGILCSKGISPEIKEIIQKLKEFYKKYVTSTETRFMYVNDFLDKSNLVKFNMFEIDNFIKEKRLAQKNDNLAIFSLSRFLKMLTYSDSNGLIVYNSKSIKFTPLDPTLYFNELKKCKSVIFASGTMEPIDQLQSIFTNIKYFNYAGSNRNVLPVIIEKGIDKGQLCLTYENRTKLVDLVVKTLVSLCEMVKEGGVVIFFPSKNYLESVKASKYIESFSRRIFYDEDFDEFKYNPQILFGVIGGKLSEGVDFKDEMCRLLIVVSVPFPSVTVEYKERCKKDVKYGVVSAMKKVNQAIGRAIRNTEDYSAVVLMDSRYVQYKNMLSEWVKEKIETQNVGQTLMKINNFLKKHGK